MDQAREAYAALPNATTSSGLAFILLLEGRVAEAVTMYHIAMDFGERQSVPRIVVSSAMNLALASISKGDYGAAKYWSGWSLRRFHALGLREELLRIALVNMDAFASLLIGSVQSAKQSLLGVTIDESVLGIPTLEGIISTLGDLELVEGNPERAIDFYSLNRASESRGSVALAANDIVRALVAAGEDERAVFVAEEAMAMAVGLPDYHVSIARLALGCAHSAGRSPLAEPLLRESIARFKKRPFSTHFAQASIHLARLYLEWSRPHDAQVVLSAARPVLLQLGDSGWRLLAGSEGQIAQLKAWVVGSRLPVHIKVLNARVVTTTNQTVHLSPRFAELLTILAAHPEGIRGEALALALYGERANQSTLKATVSRARKIVPIDSGPYRIAEPFRADFAEVLVLLQNGRVQAALELYRGPLLPESRAPMVVELRGYIEESLRQAVLASDDPDALIDFANQQGEDLQLWEEALRQLPPNDPRRPLVNARIRRIRKGW